MQAMGQVEARIHNPSSLRGLFNYFWCRTALRWAVTTTVVATLLVAASTARASSTFEEYEGRLISSIEITFEGSPADAKSTQKSTQKAQSRAGAEAAGAFLAARALRGETARTFA